VDDFTGRKVVRWPACEALRHVDLARIEHRKQLMATSLDDAHLVLSRPAKQTSRLAQLATAGPPASTLDGEVLKDGSERSFADPVLGANPLEIDPAFVETIDHHADAGQRMLHSLRAE